MSPSLSPSSSCLHIPKAAGGLPLISAFRQSISSVASKGSSLPTMQHYRPSRMRAARRARPRAPRRPSTASARTSPHHSLVVMVSWVAAATFIVSESKSSLVCWLYVGLKRKPERHKPTYRRHLSSPFAKLIDVLPSPHITSI